MKRLLFASVLAASTLWFSAPVYANVPPPLPKAADSFDAGSLHVDVYGTPGKPALVFIPGLACGPWEWSGEIARFGADYSIYALTLPGFNGRAPISGALFATVAADFWSMLDTRRIVRPAIAGHSLGGTLAFVLAEQHPEKLAGIIAVDGLPVFPGVDKMSAEQRAQAAQRFASMMASATPQQFQATEQKYVLPNYLLSKADVAAVAPLVAKSDPKAVGAWMAEDIATDARAGLKSITVPVLEVAPFDPAIDQSIFPSGAAKQAYYRSLLGGVPHAEVALVPDSRHFVMYDQPAELDSTITRFLHEVR